MAAKLLTGVIVLWPERNAVERIPGGISGVRTVLVGDAVPVDGVVVVLVDWYDGFEIDNGKRSDVAVAAFNAATFVASINCFLASASAFSVCLFRSNSFWSS